MSGPGNNPALTKSVRFLAGPGTEPNRTASQKPNRQPKTEPPAGSPDPLLTLDSMGYEIKNFWWVDGWGEYDNMTSPYVLAAHGTTYKPCHPYAHHKIVVAERMIRTITEKARLMMIDSQVPVQFWREAVNTGVYLHQRSPNEGRKR